MHCRTLGSTRRQGAPAATLFGPRPASRSGAAGFTMLELMIAIAVLTVAIFGLLAAQLYCVVLDDATKETNIALNAIRLKVDEIRSHDFISLPACYRSDVATFHPEHSAGFEVQGIELQDGDPDGLAGLVVIEQQPADQYQPIVIRVEVSWQSRDRTNRGIQIRNVIASRRY
ncbi:MAG: prepilin-type N-terminal cleavage/methylation domain-containing protein [Planctomycetota bacterium]|nr:prepilin-type N-terminal cleavage/methylation domain-containing protein [Planctomycetota bacterium]